MRQKKYWGKGLRNTTLWCFENKKGNKNMKIQAKA